MIENVQKQPVFLVSTGRCGSTFFSNVINKHPKLVSISELIEPVLDVEYFNNIDIISAKEFYEILTKQTMSERVQIWLENKTKECLYMPDDEKDISLLLCYTLPLLTNNPKKLLDEIKIQILQKEDDTPAEHFINFCEIIKSKEKKDIWIERSGGSIPHIESILKCWPNAKIIHFFRDGRQTALSMRAHPIFRAFVMRRMGIKWDINFKPPIEEFGTMWSEWEENALKVFNKYDVNLLSISYEELMQNTNDVMDGFLRFIFDTEYKSIEDKQWLDNVITNLKPAKNHLEELDDEELKKLNSSCKDTLKKLGYKIDR